MEPDAKVSVGDAFVIERLKRTIYGPVVTHTDITGVVTAVERGRFTATIRRGEETDTLTFARRKYKGMPPVWALADTRKARTLVALF